MREKRGFGPWGWLLLIFGLLVFFSNGGFFADGTNIISPAVAERLNVDQSIILTMNSVAGIVGVLIAVAAGQVNQRIGPSKVAAGCLILAGLGHIAACNAVNVPMYLIAMCFVGGGLSSGSFVGVGTLVAMWFPKRQGQAMSIVAMGSNFGTMLFVPLLNVLAGSIGMPMGSVICGGVAAVVGVIGMALLRDTPKERGLYPDNVTEAEFKANYSSAPPELDNSGWTTGKLLRTKETWLCALSTGFLMLAQMGIMTQLVARNIEVGIAPDLAVSVMSAIAVIGIIGAVIFGRILFRLGIKKAGVLTGVLYIVAMLFNISGVMPLVGVPGGYRLPGRRSPRPDELRPRLCVRSGGLRQGQQRGVPPDQHHLHVQLRRQRPHQEAVQQPERGLHRVCRAGVPFDSADSRPAGSQV